MTKRRRRRANGPPFVQLYWHLIDSHAWHVLSPLARAAYIEVARLYDGANNGRLGMSVRRLAAQMPCNKETAGKLLCELEDAGFIDLIKIGRFNRRATERQASEYRLTCFRCDVTGEPPSRRFNPTMRWIPSERTAKPYANVRPNRTSKPQCPAKPYVQAS